MSSDFNMASIPESSTSTIQPYIPKTVAISGIPYQREGDSLSSESSANTSDAEWDPHSAFLHMRFR